MRSIFHLAFNVRDLGEARRFYGDLLGCAEGRSAPTWVDFDFFGHQISLHLGEPFATAPTGRVGDQMVPMPHLGVILALPDWRVLADRLTERSTGRSTGSALDFIIAPMLRFEGQPGEQWTMFFADPSGNPIEVKGFASLETVYSV